MNILRCSAVAGLVLSVPVLGLAAEKKLQRSELPPAVEKAMQPRLQGATIKGFSTEVEGGKRLYEVELMVDGHSRDISFLANGEIAEIEEEVALDALPPEIRTALTAKAKGATITKVESLTKKERLVAYEATAKTASGKRKEFQVGPKGETLKHEE